LGARDTNSDGIGGVPPRTGGVGGLGDFRTVVVVARRSVLVGGAVGAGLLVSGCTSGGSPAPEPSAEPPDPLLAELADENRILATYDATIARYPGLSARLSPLRADHAAHAAALATALGPAAPPAPTGPAPSVPGSAATATPAPGTTTAGVPPGAAGGGIPSGGATSGAGGTGRVVVPGTAVGALAALRGVERAAVTARGTAALTAPATRARLLAGITASEASHLVVLA
jgi:hypothetical protein